jgi:acetyl-CoA carboxylase biotin carboxyl carrier protein
MASNPSQQNDSKLARDLAKILRDSELTEIELERGELRIRVAREIHAAPIAYAHAPAPAPAPAAAPQAASAFDESRRSGQPSGRRQVADGGDRLPQT